MAFLFLLNINKVHNSRASRLCHRRVAIDDVRCYIIGVDRYEKGSTDRSYIQENNFENIVPAEPRKSIMQNNAFKCKDFITLKMFLSVVFNEIEAINNFHRLSNNNCQNRACKVTYNS